MSQSTTRQVSFSIDGDFYANLMRSWVIEDRWKDAYNSMLSDMEGMTHEIAVSIFKGTHNLAGNSGDEDGIYLTEQDPECKNYKFYKETLDFQLRNIFNYNGKFYRAFAQVTSWGRSDMSWFKEMNPSYCYSKETAKEMTLGRSKYYCYEKNTEAFWINENKVILATTNDVDIPIWLIDDFKKISKDSVDFKNLSIRGYATEQEEIRKMFSDDSVMELIENQERGKLNNDRTLAYGLEAIIDERVDHRYIEPEEVVIEKPKKFVFGDDFIEQKNQYAENLRKFGEYSLAIKKQADEVENGWVTIGGKDDDEEYPTYKVARGALVNWALRQYRDTVDHIKWNPIIPSGYKMMGDDPYHSDLVVSAGIDLFNCEYFYTDYEEFNQLLYREAAKVEKELLNHNFTVINGKGRLYGKVYHLNPNDIGVLDKYKEHSPPITIVKNASPEYQLIAQQTWAAGGVVISPTGGKLCHLATICREYDGKLIILEGVHDKVLRGSLAHVDFDEHKISIGLL